MNVALLGAGMMSRAAAMMFLAQHDVTRLVIVDSSRSALDQLCSLLPQDARLEFEHGDLTQPEFLDGVFAEADCALAAVHYGLNVAFTKAAIQHRTHLVDLGGNNDVVRTQLALDEQARDAGICLTPDCGLAPGLASMIVTWGMQQYEQLDEVLIRVGGLPLQPHGPLAYERLFATEGLINEYVETPLVLRNHEICAAQPLGDHELLQFSSGVGELEACNTSGGMSTLGTSFGARIRDMDYKTLRYPGHFAAMRWLLELGMMSDVPIAHAGGTIVPRAFLRQQLESALPICSRDRTIVRVVMRGGAVPGGEQVIDVDETHDEVTNLTAMARLTAWPATAISLMQARGDVTPGALAQERSINPDRFFELLDEQGLKIPVLAATQSA